MNETYLIIKDGRIIDRVTWDGETAWQYPCEHDAVVRAGDLDRVENPMPPYDADTHLIEEYWQVDAANYKIIQCWQVTAKTASDIAREEWTHPDFKLRIVAPLALALTDIGAKIHTWFSINGLPVEKSGDMVHLYCNEVLPEHEAILTEMGLQPETTPFASYLFNPASGEMHALNTVTELCNVGQIVAGVPMLEAEALALIATGMADGCAHCLPAYNQTNGTRG